MFSTLICRMQIPFETPQTEEQLELSSVTFLGQQSRHYLCMPEEGRTSWLHLKTETAVQLSTKKREKLVPMSMKPTYKYKLCKYLSSQTDVKG